MSAPLLYSFRRCPYAIRARMALHISGISFERVEVDLKNKPPALLAVSPKATVPVLVLPNGQVIDESLDIMRYALSRNDPEHWLPPDSLQAESDALIARNDTQFKPLLDRYKYHTRHTEYTQAEHRANGEIILQDLETRLQKQPFIVDTLCRMADIALFPFVRQWAGVEKNALDAFPMLAAWLSRHQSSSTFNAVMG